MKIVYIDAQNVHRRIIDKGRILDRGKFFIYLKDHCHADIIYFAVGYVSQFDTLYSELISYGYTMLYKETIVKPNGDIKGNVDIDIAIRTILDICEGGLVQAHIVTNDGDYNTLLKVCKERGVMGYLITPDASKASRLLTKITSQIIDMQDIRHIIEKQKDLASEA